MKKIITNASGNGLKTFGPQNIGEHYILLQKQTFEALKGMSSALGLNEANELYVLSGLDISMSGSNTTYGAGIVLYNDEVYYVEEAVLNNSISNVGLEIVSTDPTGSVQFSDLTTGQIHEEIKMQWQENGNFQPSSFKQSKKSSINHFGLSEWVDVIDKKPAPFFRDDTAAVPPFTNPIKVRNLFGSIQVKGCASGTINANEPLFTLPVAFRPAFSQVISLNYSYGAGDDIGQFIFQAATGRIESLFDSNNAITIFFNFVL